jgi:hypothetical protein
MSSEGDEADASIWNFFFLYIYTQVNNFHHNSSKFRLSYDITPFKLEILFGPSMFVSELVEPQGNDG